MEPLIRRLKRAAAEAETEAFQFHKKAWPFLQELRFELVNDPKQSVGPLGGSHAIYRSRRGLFLLAGFEAPAASITFGRMWRTPSGWRRLSHRYAALAERLGVEGPKGRYEFGYGDVSKAAMDAMVEDLKSTLPAILRAVTLEDLEALEVQPFGARRVAEGNFGPTYAQQVEVSSLSDPEAG